MKFILIPVLIGILISGYAKSQCKQNLFYRCIFDSLQKNEIYVDAFNERIKKNKKNVFRSGRKWSKKLRAGNHYRFRLCENVAKRYELLLVEKINSVYSIIGTVDYTNNYIDFYCERSGEYFVIIKFREDVVEKCCCCVGVMSIIRE